MIAELDTEFFKVAGTDATEVDLTGIAAIEEQAETMIQQCETTKNEYVDGVPRSMMNMICTPKFYGKIRTYLDKVTVPGVGVADEEFYAYHGVKTSLTEERKIEEITRITPSYLDKTYENNVQDWVISMSLKYRNVFIRTN